MKVFMLTSGSYSDYHVVELFATIELAEAYIERERSMDRYATFNAIQELDVLDELPNRVLAHQAGADLLPDGTLSGMYFTTEVTKEADRDPRELIISVAGTKRITVIGLRSKEAAEKALRDTAAELRAEAAGIA